jgi:RNA polymerase sigma factor (sigma-70 family)
MSDPRTDAILEARDRLAAFLRARLPDPEAADDLVQDALLRALRAAPDLRDDDRLDAWLFQIARNAMADHHRQRARETGALAQIEPETTDPEEVAALCACFRPLLPTLSPGYAEVIEAIDLEGEPSAVAAARLGLSPGNLRVRLHRARRQLRERLEATCRTCAAHGCLDCHCRQPAV